LIKVDPTHPKINHLVVLNFRLKMAINTIRNAKPEEGNGENHMKLNPSNKQQRTFLMEFAWW